jgi:cell wall-associated NlpC family hydrolase
MPSRRDPLYQLSMMLGIMAGDKYQPLPFTEEFAQEIDAMQPAGPTAQPAKEQTMVATDEVVVPSEVPNLGAEWVPPAIRPQPRTRRDDPRRADPRPRESFGAGVLRAATQYLDIPYVYGGTNPKTGLDCSGFVQRVYADMGIALPRVTYDQVKVGQAINDRTQLRPGDLVFFTGDRGNRVNGHVGIYVGNNMMVDAPYTGARVGYRRVDWNRMTAMRRVMP